MLRYSSDGMVFRRRNLSDAPCLPGPARLGCFHTVEFAPK